MTDADLAAAVAERVMKWRCWRPGVLRLVSENTDDRQFDPAKSASDDYLVLERVRNGPHRVAPFKRALEELWMKRGFNLPANWYGYRPGDYARAALAALGEPKG